MSFVASVLNQILNAADDLLQLFARWRQQLDVQLEGFSHGRVLDPRKKADRAIRQCDPLFSERKV